MSAISPAWQVVKGGIGRNTEDNDCRIIYRTNHPSEAFMKFDNSDLSLSTVFTEEDEVTVRIGSTLMFTGYIDKITDVWNPNKKIDLLLHIMNWGDYQAAKMPFEKEYKKDTSVNVVFDESSLSIPVLGNALYIFPLASQKIKRDFAGTYVKDVWDAAAETGGGDFFCDENKVFNAFPNGFIDLLEPSTGLRYKIQAAVPSAANQIQPLFSKEIKFVRDVTNFFRKVTVTNGIAETNPADLDLFTTYKILHPTNNKEFSGYIGFFGFPSDFAPAGVFPHKFQPLTDVGSGFTMPTVRTLIPNAAAPANLTITGITFDSAGNLVQQLFNINPLDWKQLRFFIKNALAGPAVTSIKLRLQHFGGGNRWEREIYNDVKDQSGSRTNFVYLQYDLPDPANPGATGWTKIGNPTKIEQIVLSFTPSSGYTANSYVELGKIYFFRRQRAVSSSTIAGTPATNKIIVNNTAKNQTSLQNFADNEFARVSQKPIKQPDFTIYGDVNFKYPGYNIDVDFSSIFGAATRNAGTVRMDEIHHNLINGVHYTDVFLDTSFNRK